MENKEVIKPWGKYVVIEQTEDYWIKKLFITKGERISLQSHQERTELWAILEGEIEATKGETNTRLNKGEVIKIEKEEKHRIKGISDAVVLEVSFGKVDENDITRFEDDYGRNE